MKKRTKIIIAVASYVVLVGVFLLIFNHIYHEKPYDYDRLMIMVKDWRIKYIADDFKEYGVIKIEKTHNDTYYLYINNPLILKSKIDNLYNKLENDSRVAMVQYCGGDFWPWWDLALEREKIIVWTIGMTVLTGGLVVSIICINKKHKERQRQTIVN